MMDDRTRVKAAKVCGALTFTFSLALLLSAQFDFYYDLNDDTMIKDIVSGAYTGQPSGYCIQMLYPLAWCIALCYRAIPTVPWYGLFLCLCQFGVIFLITVRLLSLAQRVRTGLLALVVEAALAVGLFLREIVVIQYSVTAGICMAGAVFLFLTAKNADKPSVFFRRNLIPLLLVVLSFLIRTEICMMLLPFLLLAGLARWCGEEYFFTAVNFRKYLMLVGIAFLGMAAAYCVDLVAYQESEWSNFRSFFNARTKLYDFYGLPDYADNQKFYESIGLSQESYTLLENYNFALDESIDTWRLEAIVNYQEQSAQTSSYGSGLKNTFGFVSKNSVREALWLYRNQILKDLQMVRSAILRQTPDLGIPAGLGVRMAVLVLYLLYFAVCVIPATGKRRVLAVFKVVCLLMIRIVLWLYLYMVDRLPDRVTIPLLMLEFVMLIAFVICDNSFKKDSKVVKYILYVLCTVGFLVVSVGNLQSVHSEYQNRAQADARWIALMDYCRKNGNNYYIVDVYSSTSYQGTPYSEKIFTSGFYKNFDICGGWAAKSPLARRKLERHHFKDIQNALYNPKGRNATKAYFVVKPDQELDWLIQYYKKRGMAVCTESVDQVQTASGTHAFDIVAVKQL
ncbi:MAG: hypothetical protein K1W16_01465 [Lachnospiraceae bacterium]|jgi:hypothetical protein